MASANGIKEKAAEELKEEDKLIMPEVINIEGKILKINPNQYYNSFIINEKGKEMLINKRKHKSLLQKQLAEKIGLTQAAISSFEIGKKNINRTLLKRLCETLDIPYFDFLEKYTLPSKKYTNIELPKIVDEELAQFLGYLSGDGCLEKDRVSFFEQTKEVALAYKKKYDQYFRLSSSYKFRESKNYHQLRFTSRSVVRLIRNEFPEIKSALDTQIPLKILQSKNEVVAGFLRGLFDAEGYISGGRIGLGMNNKKMIQQIQILLLRFSIISSFPEYDNRKNKDRKSVV